jgi:hypothetical protein
MGTRLSQSTAIKRGGHKSMKLFVNVMPYGLKLISDPNYWWHGNKLQCKVVVLWLHNVILGIAICYGINKLTKQGSWKEQMVSITSAVYQDPVYKWRMLYQSEGIHSLCRESLVAETTATRKLWTKITTVLKRSTLWKTADSCNARVQTVDKCNGRWKGVKRNSMCSSSCT